MVVSYGVIMMYIIRYYLHLRLSLIVTSPQHENIRYTSPGAIVLIAPPIMAYDRECSHFDMAAELNRASMQGAAQPPPV